MCGIVGYVAQDVPFKDKSNFVSFFKEALLCDTLRGRHGTGVLGVTDKGELSIYKKAMAAPDFLELSQADKIVRATNHTFMVGHNRWATKGSHTAENSHPFSNNHIHMVHNGTINGYASLNKGVTFEVDSDAVCYKIANTESTKEVLESIEGAYSLVWYNEKDRTLNFARNTERPMYIALVKDSNSFLFGSEKGMLTWLAARNSILLKEIYSLKEGIHMKISLDGKAKWKTRPFTIKETPVRTYSYNPYQHVSQGPANKYSYLKDSIVSASITAWTPYSNVNSDTTMGNLLVKYNGDLAITINSISRARFSSLAGKPVRVKITSHPNRGEAYGVLFEEPREESKLTSNVTKLPVVPDHTRYLEGPHGKKYTHRELGELLKNGCSVCDQILYTKDHEFIGWDDSGNPYCPDCLSILADGEGFGVYINQPKHKLISHTHG